MLTLTDHQVALLRLSRCPLCAENLSHLTIFQGKPCAFCDTDLTGYGYDSDGFREAAREKTDRHLKWICLAVIVSNWFVGWFPLLSSLLAIAAAAWIKLAILYPVTSYLSPQRRLVTRLTAKILVALFLATTIIASEALTLLPCIGAIGKSALGALQVLGMALIVTKYTDWQVKRSVSMPKPAKWEWTALIALLGFLAAWAAGAIYSVFWILDLINSAS